jgi:hypothetical protein
MGRDKEKIRVWRKTYRQIPKGKAAVEKWNHSLRGKLARTVCDQARRHTEERKKYIADSKESILQECEDILEAYDIPKKYLIAETLDQDD